MKTIPALLFFAAFCVFAFTTVVRFEIIVSVTFVTALVAVILSDYGRDRRRTEKSAEPHVTGVSHHP